MTDNTEKLTIVIDQDLEDIVPGYLENRQKDIESLEKSLATGDFDLPKILGHRLKGSGAGYGFDEITEIGREIENAAIHRESQGIQDGLTALKAYLGRIEIRYE